MINNGHALAQHLHACKCALDVSGPCLEICASSDWDTPVSPGIKPTLVPIVSASHLMLHLSKLLISRLWKLYEIDFVSAGIPAVKKHLRQHPVVMQCLMSE